MNYLDQIAEEEVVWKVDFFNHLFSIISIELFQSINRILIFHVCFKVLQFYRLIFFRLF